MTGTERGLRVGLLGVGGVCGAVHYPGLSRIPGVEIASVCDPNEELVAKRQSQWQVASGHSDVDAFFAEDLDAVAQQGVSCDVCHSITDVIERPARKAYRIGCRVRMMLGDLLRHLRGEVSRHLRGEVSRHQVLCRKRQRG